MPDDFNLNENGVNLGNSDSPKKDIYFTNQDYSGIKTEKKICRQKLIKNQRKGRQCCVNILVFYNCYRRFNGYFGLCNFLLK